VQVHGGYILHLGNLEGRLKVGDKIICGIDEVCRNNIFLVSYFSVTLYITLMFQIIVSFRRNKTNRLIV